VIPGISSPRRGAADGEIPDERRLVFLGAFDERKGVRQLLEAWPLVGDLVPDPELLLLGKGPLLDWVRDRAGSLRGVSLVIDPQREEIWSALSESRVLYLLSQPAPGWKEQIGLPIVEGLSVGLEVIASSETGIADWLTQNGHRVLGPDASAEAIAHAVAEALQTTRPRAEIVATLPDVDGRLVADRWLHREPSE
jgi:glycosyltransferase involved in cell wall biosynthesis